jgi:hypothetical protein
MRTKGFCLALVAVAAVQVLVAAQWQAVSAEQEVFAVDDERTDALRHGDPQPLERVYADDYTLVTGRGEIRSKADQIAELKSGQLRYAKIDVVDRGSTLRRRRGDRVQAKRRHPTGRSRDHEWRRTGYQGLQENRRRLASDRHARDTNPLRVAMPRQPRSQISSRSRPKMTSP